MTRSWAIRGGAVVALLVLAGCHEAVLWEPRPEWVSQVAERVDTFRLGDGELPIFEIDGMRVLGDVWYSDYQFVRRMAASRMGETEQLLRLTNFTELRRIGASTSDPFAVYSVHTCTDCNPGPLSGAGRIFVFRREAGQLVLWEIWDWIAEPPSSSDSPEKEDVARILLSP